MASSWLCLSDNPPPTRHPGKKGRVLRAGSCEMEASLRQWVKQLNFNLDVQTPAQFPCLLGRSGWEMNIAQVACHGQRGHEGAQKILRAKIPCGHCPTGLKMVSSQGHLLLQDVVARRCLQQRGPLCDCAIQHCGLPIRPELKGQH